MHSGIFGVTVEEWDEVKDSVPVMEVDPAEQQKRLEASFLENEHDSFAFISSNAATNSRDTLMNSDYLKSATLSRSVAITIWSIPMYYRRAAIPAASSTAYFTASTRIGPQISRSQPVCQ